MFRISENTADALRNTLAVLLPLLLLYSIYPQTAIGMSVGALLISLTDMPGNRLAKTRSAIQCVSIFFVVTLLFSISLSNHFWTGVVLVAFTFLLSMLPALGGRSAAGGMMGVALMVFLLGIRPHDPWAFSAYIMLGGIWFYVVVLVQVYIWPYRSLRQAIQEALYTTGEFLQAKSVCYDVSQPLDDGYRRTIALHLRVSEKQELVRQLLISDRAAFRRSSAKVQQLAHQSMLVIRLYEQVTAMHYDYAVVRQNLSASGALAFSKELIQLLAAQAKDSVVDLKRFELALVNLEACAIKVSKADAAVISGIATNVKAIKATLDDIQLTNPHAQLTIPNDAEAFLPDSGNYKQKLRAQLHFSSPVLRFALRLAVLMAIGYISAWLFADDNYSYWLLLTIVIVARPRLAVTWQRNRERLLGTFAGVLITGLLIWQVQAAAPLLVIASIALFGFFAWNRPRYGWSVACVTVCVLVSLSVYRGEPLLLLSARIWYSLLGCVLAVAGIFLFPVWSHAELKGLVKNAVRANRGFLQAVTKEASIPEIWLARKEAHVQMARLSEGLAHARMEPGKGDLSVLDHIQVLNYRINAVIISVFLAERRSNRESMLQALVYLNDFLSGNKHSVSLAENEKLLKGTQLLERLSHELSTQTLTT